MASFDTIARAYEILERLTFANRLQTARLHCLPYLKHCQRALLIGDGDGRFSSALLNSNPHVTIDSIDLSPRMLQIAKERAAENAERLTAIQHDTHTYTYPKSNYDFIGLHFCLDCFTQSEIDAILPKLEAALRPAGLLAYSDFQATALWQRCFIRTLYLCFRASTGLKTNHLPKVLWSEQLQTTSSHQQLQGLVFSQLLQKKEIA